MNPRKDQSGTPVQPSLSDLMARYLGRQTVAQGMGFIRAEAAGEVVPFEAVPVQPVDACVAWGEATAVLRQFQPGTETPTRTAPPDWASLVDGHEPATTLAFAVGNFPQLVRDWQPLLQATDLTSLKRMPTRSLPAARLVEWADQVTSQGRFPEMLLVVGALRLARQYDRAAETLQSREGVVPSEWRGAWANEQAALAWHRGHVDEAAALWRAQPASAPVLFNRGMAALFLGRTPDARSALGKAVTQLPEDGAWHHLGRLYLALAETRD
jgi:hypothetical protein